MTLAYSYELPFDCSACGKTAWCKLIGQFSRMTRKGDVNNQLAEHDRLTVLTGTLRSTNYFQRLNLESWFTDSPKQVSITIGSIQMTYVRY